MKKDTKEEAPVNSIAGGGVDMAPNSNVDKKIDGRTKIYKRISKRIKERKQKEEAALIKVKLKQFGLVSNPYMEEKEMKNKKYFDTKSTSIESSVLDTINTEIKEITKKRPILHLPKKIKEGTIEDSIVSIVMSEKNYKEKNQVLVAPTKKSKDYRDDHLGGDVKVIDKKDLSKWEKKGYELVEDSEVEEGRFKDILIDKEEDKRLKDFYAKRAKSKKVKKVKKEDVELDEAVSAKEYDSLKKGDTVTIDYKSSMSSGKATFKVTAKNVVGKARVGKVTLQSIKNPRGVKYFLYKRGNNVSFAEGDMGASVVSFTKEEVELDEAGRPRGATHIENERFWDLKDKELHYIIKDAGKAIQANPTAKKATEGPGNWSDQVNDAATVLSYRKNKKIKVEGFEGERYTGVAWKTKAKDGGEFVVFNRVTRGMPGKQDKFFMRHHMKNGKLKDYGSHVSVDGAKKFAKSRGIIEGVEVNEEDAYDKDRYAMTKKGATIDNPSRKRNTLKDKPYHVWATSPADAVARMKKRYKPSFKENVEEAFSKKQITDLRKKYAKVKKNLSMKEAEKFFNVLNKLDIKSLNQLVNAKINFVSDAAKTELTLRGSSLVKESTTVIKELKEITEFNKMLMARKDYIHEGTWAIPSTQKEYDSVMKLMKRPIPAKGAEKKYFNVIGDDGVWDDVADILKKEGPKGDIRPAFKKFFDDLKIKMFMKDKGIKF